MGELFTCLLLQWSSNLKSLTGLLFQWSGNYDAPAVLKCMANNIFTTQARLAGDCKKFGKGNDSQYNSQYKVRLFNLVRGSVSTHQSIFIEHMACRTVSIWHVEQEVYIYIYMLTVLHAIYIYRVYIPFYVRS